MGKATEQRFTSAMPQLRNFFVVLGLLFIAVMAQGLSWHWWLEAFVLNRVHAIYAGIHLDVLIEQIPAMLVFLLLGAVGFFVFESAPVLLWPAVLGAAGSLFRAAMTRSSFTDVADLADKINYFATYAYPPLFALAGLTLAWLRMRRRGTPLTRLAATRKRRR